METEKKKKPENPSVFPSNMIGIQAGITLRDFAQIKFMAAVISNEAPMIELTRAYKADDRGLGFEDVIANLGGVYADAMLEHRSKNE